MFLYGNKCFLERDFIINKNETILKLQDVVAQNETLQMVVGMKIKQNLPQSGRVNNASQRNEYLLALSNRIVRNVLNNDLNLEHVNFQILGANVNDLIRNTRCANSDNQDNHHQHNHNRNQAHQFSKSDDQNNNQHNNQAHHSSRSDNQNNNQHNKQAHHSSRSDNENNNHHNNQVHHSLKSH